MKPMKLYHTSQQNAKHSFPSSLPPPGNAFSTSSLKQMTHLRERWEGQPIGIWLSADPDATASCGDLASMPMTNEMDDKSDAIYKTDGGRSADLRLHSK